MDVVGDTTTGVLPANESPVTIYLKDKTYFFNSQSSELSGPAFEDDSHADLGVPSASEPTATITIN